jgi:proteasome lid subunit RPN8/RPN11
MEIIMPSLVLESCLQGAAESYPREFIGLLSGKKNGDRVQIERLYLAPLAESDETSTSFNPYHVPTGMGIVGSFHSHPAGPARPSAQDLMMFSSTGSVHLIAACPFSAKSVAAFDGKGNSARLEIV